MDPSPPNADSPRFLAFAQQNDGSAGGREQRQQHIQRHASESGASENHDDDGDERMSNDESMSSSSSSLDIEDVVGAVDDFQDDKAFKQRQHQHAAMLKRPASFSEAYLHQQQQMDSNHHLHQQDANQMLSPLHSQQQQHHPRSPSLDFSPGASSPRTTNNGKKRPRRDMWLFTQFAPAMSKSARSTEQIDSMEDGSDDVVRVNDGKQQEENRKLVWATGDCRWEYTKGVQVVAARNEVTGIQLRLQSNKDFQVTTDCTNWFPPLGHVPRARVHADLSFIPPQLQVEVFIVGYVEDENNEMMMEYFARSGVSTSPAKEHAVYIRLRIAHNVRSGVYEIPVRIFTQHAGFSDEELTWSSYIHARVANIVLPSPHEWKFHLDLWQHLSSIARTHAVALWSDRHFALIDNYLAKLSEFGQKCITIVATEMPWAGQQCYLEVNYPSALYEHALLEVYESPSLPSGAEAIGETVTTLKIDFQHFDRLLALATKHHMDAEIEIFGLLSIWRDPANGFDGPVDARSRLYRRRSSSSLSSLVNGRNPSEQTIGEADVREKREGENDASSSSSNSSPIDSWRIRCFNRQTGKMRYLRRMAEVERFIGLFYEHCVALGIVERIRVCADEPSELSLFYEQLRFLQRLAPGFKIKLALNNLDFLNFAPPQVVDYVPLLPLVCADLEVTKRMKAQIHERGGRFCWYVCCGPRFPNQFVSSPLIEGELVGYLTFFLELDGFLRWNYCLWPAKPWEDLKWRSPSWKVGDMYFVLPGKDGFPVETLRLESLRFAIQVYELLRLAQETLSHVQLEQLKAEISQLIWRTSDFSQFCRLDDKARSDLYSLDPLDYQRAKVLVIDTLAAAKLAASSGSHGSTLFDERIGSPPSPPVSPQESSRGY